jgi:acetoin utilization deacetylase AcuC-like enzyme
MVARPNFVPISRSRREAVDVSLLAQVHDERYIAAAGQVALRDGAYWDADTLISPGSYEAALLGAGGAMRIVCLSLKRNRYWGLLHRHWRGHRRAHSRQ